MGSISKYNSDRARQAYQLALLGLTEKQMAAVMDVSDKTIELWKNSHSRFATALREGKEVADGKVAHSLNKRANGFTINSEHISVYKGEVTRVPIKVYYPPDTNAAIKWLELRQGKLWSRKDGPGVINNIRILKIDLSGCSMEELKLAEKLGLRQHNSERAEDIEEETEE